MDFDLIYKSIFPTEKSILEVVDEYTLYCFYTGYDDLQLNKAYNSPFREDYFPSFSIYPTKYDLGVEFYWKDHATGDSGNIFKLISLIEQLNSKEEVFQKINDDFALGLHLSALEQREKISYYKKPEQNNIEIRIGAVPLTESGLNFWKQYDIDKPLLDLYQVEQIQYYWSYKEQEHPNSVTDPTFSYRIGKYYQIYSPLAPRSYKFRNNLPEHYFFGYQQLSRENEKLLVIDKAMKDVIFCRRIGLQSVAPKSESTPIPEPKMLEFKERYKEVYIMFDSDKAGRENTEKYIQKYPWLKPRFLPEVTGKDKTDTMKKVGLEETKKIVYNLLQ